MKSRLPEPDRTSYQYRVIRYTPDQIRGEFLNVGVIMQMTASRVVLVRTVDHWYRVQAVFPETNPKSLTLFLNMLRSKHEKAMPKYDLSDERQMSGLISMSDLRGGVDAHDPLATLNQLYKMFVLEWCAPRIYAFPTYARRSNTDTGRIAQLSWVEYNPPFFV